MRAFLILPVAYLLAASTACTKKNPNLCCDNEADCQRLGLDSSQACEEGLVCRGNQCIAIPCETSANCDLATPFCDVASGLCSETCATDDQCPGFSGAPVLSLCADGACVQCREDTDCSPETPVCDSRACRACAAHAECASGVCTDAGTCADPTSISYVAPSGSPASDCTAASRCNLTRAVDLIGTHPYVVLADGNYATTDGLRLNGNVHFIGSRANRPTVRRVTEGPVIGIDLAATVILESIVVADAFGQASSISAAGVTCGISTDARYDLRHVRLENNASRGIVAFTCEVSMTDTEITGSAIGLDSSGSVISVERSQFVHNGSGARFSGGSYSVRNSIFARNTVQGLSIDVFPGVVFDFNTIVDNGTAITCSADGGPDTIELANSIIARNGTGLNGTGCTATTSLVTDAVDQIRFVRPDIELYDYHITAGSSAVDQATGGDLDNDIDGEPRPFGAARDLGADELQQ